MDVNYLYKFEKIIKPCRLIREKSDSIKISHFEKRIKALEGHLKLNTNFRYLGTPILGTCPKLLRLYDTYIPTVYYFIIILSAVFLQNLALSCTYLTVSNTTQYSTELPILYKFTFKLHSTQPFRNKTIY